MKILFVVPGWPPKSFWDVLYFKFPPLSMATLAGYAFLIFLVDWATGANYMHLGQHNPLEIPFLPKSFTVWPWTYPSFVAVGVILFHLAYLSFRGLEKKASI